MLKRVAEDFNVTVSFHPKLIGNNLKSFYTYSNLHMREDLEDPDYIKELTSKLKEKHNDHLILYN